MNDPRRQPDGDGLSSEDILLFKICAVAIWSDGAMAAAERDHLSHLMDRAEVSDGDRDELRRIALHSVSRSAVLDDVAGLNPAAKRRIYERCIAVLTADRRLRRDELRFIDQLRRRCGIGAFSHQLTVWRASPGRHVVRGALLLVLAVLAVWMLRVDRGGEPTLRPPAALTAHRPILLIQAAADLPKMDAEALFEAIRHSVVKINVVIDQAVVGHGSGVVIGVDQDRQLYVLTNRHVVFHEVDPSSRLSYEVELENGVQLPALLDYYSRDHDLAVVLVPGLSGWGLPAPLRMCSDLAVGEEVWALGSPIGLDHSFTRGSISALRGDMVQTDATVAPGSSGGPLFDSRGRVCGIVTTSHSRKDFSFALCGERVLEMLDARLATASETTAPGGG